MTLLLVLVGGALGAPLRYLLDRAVQARHDSAFPWGTFAVNVAGSLLLGLVAGVSGPAYALLGTGLCGALTTYSTLSYETLRLLEEAPWYYALANVVGTVLAGLGA
ncbi:MAG: CrcB family protein, partial [Micromonosporaceae bacterium]|nr:CrcB family protein [Micromonosporaceae bacterium]